MRHLGIRKRLSHLLRDLLLTGFAQVTLLAPGALGDAPEFVLGRGESLLEALGVLATLRNRRSFRRHDAGRRGGRVVWINGRCHQLWRGRFGDCELIIRVAHRRLILDWLCDRFDRHFGGGELVKREVTQRCGAGNPVRFVLLVPRPVALAPSVPDGGIFRRLFPGVCVPARGLIGADRTNGDPGYDPDIRGPVRGWGIWDVVIRDGIVRPSPRRVEQVVFVAAGHVICRNGCVRDVRAGVVGSGVQPDRVPALGIE